MNKKYICLMIFLAVILLLTTTISTGAIEPGEPGLRKCWHVLCVNGEDFLHCGSETALGNRIRARCGR